MYLNCISTPEQVLFAIEQVKNGCGREGRAHSENQISSRPEKKNYLMNHVGPTYQVKKGCGREGRALGEIRNSS